VQISLVAAMANNRVIGKDNQMPWHMPADLKHFKAVTMGHPIIMGRRTFDSLGRPLPGRLNIVVSRQLGLEIPGVVVVSSLEKAIELVHQESEVMVIGGQMLFELALPLAHKMFLTFIDTDIEGDTFFPAWDQAEWEVVSEQPHQADDKNPFNYRFVDYARTSQPA